MSYNPASPLSPALLMDLESVIARSIRTRQPSFTFIDVDDELVVCEYLRSLDADIDGDSEADGPDTIRATGPGGHGFPMIGWTLVLKVH